jgi:hypothetical protein
MQVWGQPDVSVFAYGSPTLDIYPIADFMAARGWHIVRQLEPPGIHVVVTPRHERVVDPFLADLREAATFGRWQQD